MKFKYIKHNLIGFIIWPAFLDDRFSHREMAQSINIGLERRKTKGKVLSAGFIEVNMEGRFICYGQSASLGIKSHQEDTKLLTELFINKKYSYCAGPMFLDNGRTEERNFD